MTPLLVPCPLCGGESYDKGYGISCVKCGLWLENGTQAIEHGGYKKLWNSRPSEDNDEHPHLQRTGSTG
jgi:hypothetical protein